MLRLHSPTKLLNHSLEHHQRLLVLLVQPMAAQHHLVDNMPTRAAHKVTSLLEIISKVVSDAVKANKHKIKDNGMAKTTKEDLGMGTRNAPLSVAT
jgi:hypothetical protein